MNKGQFIKLVKFRGQINYLLRLKKAGLVEKIKPDKQDYLKAAGQIFGEILRGRYSKMRKFESMTTEEKIKYINSKARRSSPEEFKKETERLNEISRQPEHVARLVSYLKAIGQIKDDPQGPDTEKHWAQPFVDNLNKNAKADWERRSKTQKRNSP